LTDDTVEKTQVDTKKAMSDRGNKMAYAKADAKNAKAEQ
jgi:hypothetical protein